MMPDISMCKGDGCSVRLWCHRYTARPDPNLQSYFVTPPGQDENCKHYWQTHPEAPKPKEVPDA